MGVDDTCGCLLDYGWVAPQVEVDPGYVLPGSLPSFVGNSTCKGCRGLPVGGVVL